MQSCVPRLLLVAAAAGGNLFYAPWYCTLSAPLDFQLGQTEGCQFPAKVRSLH